MKQKWSLWIACPACGTGGQSPGMRLFKRDVRVVCRSCGRVIVTDISPGMLEFVKWAFALLSYFVGVVAFFLVFSKNWLFLSLLLAGFTVLHVGTFLRLHAKNAHIEEGDPELPT
jgi:hypothetical protein